MWKRVAVGPLQPSGLRSKARKAHSDPSRACATEFARGAPPHTSIYELLPGSLLDRMKNAVLSSPRFERLATARWASAVQPVFRSVELELDLFGGALPRGGARGNTSIRVNAAAPQLWQSPWPKHETSAMTLSTAVLRFGGLEVCFVELHPGERVGVWAI